MRRGFGQIRASATWCPVPWPIRVRAIPGITRCSCRWFWFTPTSASGIVSPRGPCSTAFDDELAEPARPEFTPFFAPSTLLIWPGTGDEARPGDARRPEEAAAGAQRKERRRPPGRGRPPEELANRHRRCRNRPDASAANFGPSPGQAPSVPMVDPNHMSLAGRLRRPHGQGRLRRAHARIREPHGRLHRLGRPQGRRKHPVAKGPPRRPPPPSPRRGRHLRPFQLNYALPLGESPHEWNIHSAWRPNNQCRPTLYRNMPSSRLAPEQKEDGPVWTHIFWMISALGLLTGSCLTRQRLIRILRDPGRGRLHRAFVAAVVSSARNNPIRPHCLAKRPDAGEPRVKPRHARVAGAPAMQHVSSSPTCPGSMATAEI